MLEPSHNDELPPIPGKRYFTIGEVSDLCAVKPHAALLGAGIPAAQPGEAPRKPPLLSAPGRADDPPDPRAPLRPGLHHRRGAPALSGDEAKDDVTQYKQLIRQMIAELEEVLLVLKK